MDSRAIEQAATRLKKAKKALESFQSADNYDAEEAWIEFLQATSTIYAKLEQGAKVSGKTGGWFGRKKKERRDDPLLRYLHYARNSEEHGIERVVKREAGVSFEGPLRFGELRRTTVNFVDGTKNAQTVEQRDFIQTGPCLILVRAHDQRFNDYCDPPTHHLGHLIGAVGKLPYHVGLLGLSYFGKLILEAEEYVCPSKNIAT
jgi:hypothetical protein